MAAAIDLFGCEDPLKWLKVSDIYWDVVHTKGANQQRLIVLDKWYQEELSSCIAARPHKFLTREELIKLMEWKLTRGRFRPRLHQLVYTNTDKTVESCTGRAFQLLPDVPASISELCKLKGIGPATASAVLAIGAPDLAAFMADEAVESVPGLAPVQYTLKHYMRFLEALRQKSAALSKACSQPWTPHRVELCLWAWAVAQKLCPDILESEEHPDDDERPVKKLKTQ
ncbi:uncharacterized protein RCH25_036839 [Pelodytes ibericus]